MTPERKAELRHFVQRQDSHEISCRAGTVLELLDALDAADQQLRIAQAEVDLRTSQANVATSVIAEARKELGAGPNSYIPDLIRDLRDELAAVLAAARIPALRILGWCVRFQVGSRVSISSWHGSREGAEAYAAIGSPPGERTVCAIVAADSLPRTPA
jgi:hypothetical protein